MPAFYLPHIPWHLSKSDQPSIYASGTHCSLWDSPSLEIVLTAMITFYRLTSTLVTSLLNGTTKV